MSSPSSRYPLLRSYAPRLGRLLALAVPLALGACDGGDSPLAPADAPADAPAEQTFAAADSAPAADLALAGTAQRILFVSTRAGGYDVFKMDPTGANVSRVTFFGYYGTEPAWSWDNQRIALVRPRKDAQNVEHADIFLMNADGTNKHWARSQPSSFDMRYPSWSPDGVHLVMAIMLGGKPYLATMDVTNGNMAFVLFAGKVIQGNFPSYDATGRRILYVNATGKEIHELDVPSDTGYLLVSSEYVMACPKLSPDGTRIAFQRVVGSNVDVYVKYLYGGTVRRLTTDPAYDGVPTWSPDGTRIAFQSDRTGKSQIYVMNAGTGGSLTRITNTAFQEKSPAWSH
jgi:Tol biopolymer transport system component